MSEQQKPSVGRIVHFHGMEPTTNNGTHLAPAIITRVWSDICVNLTVFPDNAPPVCKTSVYIAEASDDLGRSLLRWTWPPRI